MTLLILLPLFAVLDLPGGELSQIDWSEVTYPLIVDDWRLKGEGATVLADWARESQFVLFGEQHGIKRIHAVVTAAYFKLIPEGYEYLALEMGPWFAHRISRSGATPALSENPHSFAFGYDGQVRLLDLVESMYEGRSEGIWGLDQELISIHLFARLADILPTAAGRRAARGLFLKSSLLRGEYLRKNHFADLQALRKVAGPDINQEASLILDSLQNSMEIYVAYRARQKDGSIFVSDRTREQYMCERLDAQIQVAAGHGEPLPKAIFLLGGAHIMEGIGPNGVTTLGDYAQSLAGRNQLDALNIGIRTYSDDTPLPPSIFPSDATITLLDARAVRDLLPATSDNEHEARLLRDLRQFDALILVRDGTEDSRDIMSGHKSSFRQSMIIQIAAIVLPIAAFLSMLWPSASVMRIRLRSKEARIRHPASPWLILAAGFAFFLTLTGLQFMHLLSGSPTDAVLTSASWMVAVEILAAAVFATLAVAAIHREWWTVGRRIHYVIVAASGLGLLWYCYWWNVGGMLGSHST